MGRVPTVGCTSSALPTTRSFTCQGCPKTLISDIQPSGWGSNFGSGPPAPRRVGCRSLDTPPPNWGIRRAGNGSSGVWGRRPPKRRG
eukprot:14838829-Alexandrium_andersonii.AAC.1